MALAGGKVALIFWWVSLAAAPANEAPQAGVTLGSTYVDQTGVRRERVQFFDSMEKCKSAQGQQHNKHKNDFILVSVCGGAGGVGIYGDITAEGKE